MLTSSGLSKASTAYQAGYRDAASEKPARTDLPDRLSSPFGTKDYQDGYEAGQNDLKWDRYYAERATKST